MLQGITCLLEFVLVAAVKNDVESELGELMSIGFSDTVCGAGDDCPWFASLGMMVLIA